ncbi:MAG: ribosome biogenesis GTPase YlqF [Clostridiales bacterium]|nr:ribosome biogenesis GTPase YlqF [Clostridiales bacterium]
MPNQAIQWFPGHMAKTRKLMAENLKLVDVVLEILDARLPMSSRNPLINDLVGEKPRVLVLAKADLAEEAQSKTWAAYFRKQGMVALACDLKGPNAKGEMKAVIGGMREQTAGLIARRQARGISSRVIRAMVTGIPNSGKSTLINLVAGKARAETGDRPGVTRGKQWIRLEQDLELLDMPGILWPNLEDREGARKLAVTGAIGENAYHPQELALWLIRWLRERRPGRLSGRYGVPESGSEGEVAEILGAWQEERDMSGMTGYTEAMDGYASAVANVAAAADMAASPAGEEGFPGGGEDLLSLAILEAVGRRRGFLRKGGVVERDKTAVMLLDELRGGRLGRVTLDEPPAEGAETAEAG